MKKIVECLSDESGVTLLLVIGVVLVLTILGLGIIARGSNEQQVTVKSIEGTRAFHAADAGVQQAIWRIQDSLSGGSVSEDAFSLTLGPNPTKDGSAEVSIVRDPDSAWYWTIISTGRVGNVARKVKASVFCFSLWDVDISTGGGMNPGGSSSGAINGNASFSGPLYVNGTYPVSGSTIYEKGPLLIYDGNLQIGSSGAQVGTASEPIEAYIHTANGYLQVSDFGDPFTPYSGNKLFLKKLSADVPKITLPPMRALSLYRQDAYDESLAENESTSTVYPGIAWDVYRSDGQFGEKVIDNDGDADLLPSSYKTSGWHTYHIGASIPKFGFDGGNEQLFGATALDKYDPGNAIDKMTAFAWDQPTRMLYLSQTGKAMTVYIEGNLILDDDTYFKGVGTLIVNGDLTINGKLRAQNPADFPVLSAMGIVVNGDIIVNSGTGSPSYANPDFQGAWYARGKIKFMANNPGFVGTMITSGLEVAQNAHFWTVTGGESLADHLPPNLPGFDKRVTSVSGWREIIK